MKTNTKADLVSPEELAAWEKSDGEYLNRHDARRLMATVRANWKHPGPENPLATFWAERSERAEALCALLESKEQALLVAIRDLTETGKRVEAERDELRDRLAQERETWTDEHGTCWTRPTAWAYAQACRALHEKQDHLTALLSAGEPFERALESWNLNGGQIGDYVHVDSVHALVDALEKARRLQLRANT